MRNSFVSILMCALCVPTSCVSDSEEDLMTNCLESDLVIIEVGTTIAGCNVSGSLEVSSEGGEGGIVFSIDGEQFQPSGLFSVSGGTYTVIAEDNSGCSSSIDVTVEAALSAITISSVISTSSDCGMSNGRLEIDATGGSGTLSYQLDNGSPQSSNSFTGLGVGNYLITISNEQNCEVNRSATILTDTSLTQDIMPIMNANCAISSACHNSSSSRTDLSVSSNVISNAAGIKSRTQSGNMPRGSATLSQSQIALIACWVDDGGRNN